MTTLEVQIPDDVASKIRQAAQARGVSVDELVRATLEEKLARDSEFESAADHGLSKNSELYKRLS